MKENNEITGLFRSRLAGAEMTVRDGFWEELQGDLQQVEAAGAKDSGTLAASAGGKRRFFLSPKFHRLAAVASVALVLGMASAAFWYFSPKEEIKEAFTQVACMTPEGSLNGDVVQENFPSIHQADVMPQKPGVQKPAGGVPAGLTADSDEESVSVHVSIRITQRVYGNHQQPGNSYYSNNNGTYQANSGHTNTSQDKDFAAGSEEEPQAESPKSPLKSRKWAIKAALGSSLPKGDFTMPFTAGLTVERRLNDVLSLETGLQYNRLSGGRTLHTLGVPVKLNVLLASAPKLDLYATVGGAAEKCIAGASDNGFGAEPVQLSMAAGLGVRYKVNDRFALFAEPTVSHHFDTDSQTRTLRTERPTNLNLLCGVRMTY